MPIASSVVSSNSRRDGTRIWSLMRSSRNAMDAPSLLVSSNCRCYHAEPPGPGSESQNVSVSVRSLSRS